MTLLSTNDQKVAATYGSTFRVIFPGLYIFPALEDLLSGKDVRLYMISL